MERNAPMRKTPHQTVPTQESSSGRSHSLKHGSQSGGPGRGEHRVTPSRLFPPAPPWVAEAELITEFLFLDSIVCFQLVSDAQSEFFRRLPRNRDLPRFGRASSSWVEYLDQCQRMGFVLGNGSVNLTLMGKSQLDSLRYEARQRGVALPA